VSNKVLSAFIWFVTELLLRTKVANNTLGFLTTECPVEQVHADFDVAVRDRVTVVSTDVNETLR
jgi:hypothetical protein